MRGGNINNNVYNCMWSLAMYSNYFNIHFLHHGLEPCSFLLRCVYLTVSYCITIDNDCTWYPTMTKNLMLCLRYCKHSCCPCALLDAWYYQHQGKPGACHHAIVKHCTCILLSTSCLVWCAMNCMINGSHMYIYPAIF